MSELNAQDLAWLFNGGTDRRASIARQMRGDELPDWMAEAFAIMAAKQNDPTIKANGEPHTIESMVDDLRDRVKLDSIQKQAGYEPPLFVRAEAEDEHQKNADRLLAGMADYLERHLLKPGHGQSPLPALFEAIKEKFGIDGVSRAGGIEKVKVMIEKLKKEHESPNPANDLPIYDGSPMMMGREDSQSKDRSDFLTQDTSKQM